MPSTTTDVHGARGEVLRDFADKQTPRAAVITRADSRVHSRAWDLTPENDDFTVRDIGNQVQNVEGSVEYGIEHLHTPLLLIIGHTGCGAVKAAMGDGHDAKEAKAAKRSTKAKTGRAKSNLRWWRRTLPGSSRKYVASALRQAKRSRSQRRTPPPPTNTERCSALLRRAVIARPRSVP